MTTTNRRKSILLPIDSVSVTSETQIREKVNEATVQRYADLMEAKGRSAFPPIIVYRDADDNHWIADGHHRIMATIQCQLTEIRAVVREGSKADALWAAAEINSKNALPLTNNDIRKAIMMLLEAWPDRSNTMIADALGCTEGTVRYHLKQVRKVTNLTQAEDSADKRVVGKDGKSYPARKAVSKKQTPKGSQSRETGTKDSLTSESPVSVQQADETTTNESQTVETTEQCSVSSDRNVASPYEQKLMHLLPLSRAREKGSQSDDTVYVPLSAPDRLVACLFESFDTPFRERVLDTLTRAMLANDGKEPVLKIIAPLYDDIRKLSSREDDT